MKKKLSRRTMGPLTTDIKGVLGELSYDQEGIGDLLVKHLQVFMSQSLDPDLQMDKAGAYVNHLMTNGLGDFKDAYILTLGQGQIKGILIGLRQNKVLHITSLGVDPAYRKMGIGTSLLEAARLQMRKENIEVLSLDVHTLNRPALKMYTKLGFK